MLNWVDYVHVVVFGTQSHSKVVIPENSSPCKINRSVLVAKAGETCHAAHLAMRSWVAQFCWCHIIAVWLDCEIYTMYTIILNDLETSFLI